jgi:hypothetical protein
MSTKNYNSFPEAAEARAVALTCSMPCHIRSHRSRNLLSRSPLSLSFCRARSCATPRARCTSSACGRAWTRCWQTSERCLRPRRCDDASFWCMCVGQVMVHVVFTAARAASHVQQSAQQRAPARGSTRATLRSSLHFRPPPSSRAHVCVCAASAAGSTRPACRAACRPSSRGCAMTCWCARARCARAHTRRIPVLRCALRAHARDTHSC